MTLEELEFLRCIEDDDTILKTYKQLKIEGKTNEEIIIIWNVEGGYGLVIIC